VLGSLRFLLETDGFAVRTFRNATALLNAAGPSCADCYVIDVLVRGRPSCEFIRSVADCRYGYPY
jgi:FixJ family two-component response regulator